MKAMEKNRLPATKQYTEAMTSVARRMNERHWDSARASAIGGAGLSTAVVFLITQLSVKSEALSLSFFCASIAIPIWVALWQIGESYSFHGPESHGHFATVGGSGLGGLLFVTGGILVLISFVALLWQYSPSTSLSFLVVSLIALVIVYRHQMAVRAWAERRKSAS